MELEKPLILVPDDPGPEALGEMLKVIVLKVFDGDGFLADVWHPLHAKWINRIPFRLAFIDAPEMEQPFGAEAMEFLHQQITSKTLRLEPIGKESTGFLPIDQYKRMLCMAYLSEEMPAGRADYFLDGRCRTGTVKRPRRIVRNVELELVVNGWAWVTEQYAFDREDEYFAAQDDARRARRGLWAIDNPEPPWDFKQRRKRRRKTIKPQGTLFTQRCQADGCDGQLIERTGAHGSFLGCSNFPRCRFSRSLD